MLLFVLGLSIRVDFIMPHFKDFVARRNQAKTKKPPVSGELCAFIFKMFNHSSRSETPRWYP